ncbi:MAG: response regulator, partial [bacterium]|nr:response regulator [bacterium]
SEVNKGSEFLIIVDQKIKKEQNNQEKEDKYLRKSKILVVNDKSNELKKIENKLVSMGYDVTTTLYGKDAVEKIKSKEGYNLIIIDDEMNLKSGYDTLKELKKNKKFNIPVIITLEENKKFLKDKYLEDGFSDYIMKDNLDEEIKKVTKFI